MEQLIRRWVHRAEQIIEAREAGYDPANLHAGLSLGRKVLGYYDNPEKKRQEFHRMICQVASYFEAARLFDSP